MKFKKGTSGNPTGRPPGIPDRRTELRRKLEDRSGELLDTAIEQALEGDSGLMRALLGRVIAPAKPETLPASFTLPHGSLTEQAQAVMVAIASGQLPTSTGSELLSAMAQVAKIREADELESRIERLESAQNDS
jgi:hypothetical protein